MKILLTDIYFRKSFDVINILKLHYSNKDFIYTISEKNTFSSLKLNLTYGSRKPYLLRKGNNFSEDLKNLTELFEEEIVYVPIEEETTLLFINYISDAKVSNKLKFLLPDKKKFALSRNKESLNIFCQENSIPCPKYISQEDFKNKDFSFPIILKPKIGSGSKGISYIDSLQDLNGHNIDFNEYFVQERLKNPRDVEAGLFLCKEGKIISFYSHKRIRTYPETGGVTVFSKCKETIEIRETGSRIIEKLNWSGLLMIEYIFDENDNTFKLIEINPRLWGSIMLSEFCNANFLKNYVSLSLNTEVSDSILNYTTFIRWIFPYDIFYWLKNISNPFSFFKKNKNTCYINFTYTFFLRSIIFIVLTYFDLKKIKKLLNFG